MTIALAALLAAAPLTLEADPAHSSAGFAVKHMVVTTVRGQFDKVASTLEWNKDDPTKSSVEVKIDAASIDTHNDKRDGHLKSADFFDVEKCPEISFKSEKIQKAGKSYKVTGPLTMHCQTRPVTLQAVFSGPQKTPMGTTVYAAEVTGKLKRSDWGLKWNKAIEGGGVVVSDDVNLDLNFEYGQKAEAKKEAQAESKPEKK
ncbi:MAG TPA: YceI family protein [Myxococcales bacterium]|nr:YceI family protein [Myxococcales bacterium]